MNKRIAKTFALGAACLFPLAFFAQQKEGQAWSWGFGRNGQLGLGSQANYSLPHQIKGVSFVDIDTKRSISAGVTKDGKLFTWGKNRNGVLGHYPPNLNVLVPRRVDLQQRVAEVSCGYQNLCVVTQEGQAFVWGFDQIKTSFRSIGTSESKKSDQNIAPLKIHIKDVKHATCANQYIAFLRKDGKVFVLGDTSVKGVNGIKAKSKSELVELELKNIIKIVSGINFSLALNDEGKVYVWGNNTFGQLGTGGLRNVDQPTILDTLMKEQVIDIACGDNFAGVVTKKGQVYTWGFGNQGQLGHGDKSDQFLPRKISSLQAKIRSISCGGAHTALLAQNGKLLVVGRGRQGQLGRELKDQSNSGYALFMKQVEQLPHQSSIKKVVCGANHTIILLNEIL